MMYDSLIKYFNSYSTKPLTGDEIDLIQSFFNPKKFRKRQYFLQEGETCKHTAFIVKGAMRQYMVDDKGEEHIIQLFIENWWASDRESQVKETPSKYFIDAWEDTETLLVLRKNVLNIIDQIPSLLQWIRNMDE